MWGRNQRPAKGFVIAYRWSWLFWGGFVGVGDLQLEPLDVEYGSQLNCGRLPYERRGKKATIEPPVGIRR